MEKRISKLLHPSRWEPGTRRRAASAVAVVLLVLGWRLAVYASRARLRALGHNLVEVCWLVKHPVPNHAGTRVLFAQRTATGGGIYSLNVKTGERVQVYEFPDRRLLSGNDLLLLEWPPDDSVLAYARPMKGKKQQVVFGSPLLGSKVGTFAVKGTIQEFRWLTPFQFVYLNESNRLFMASRNSRGKWAEAREFEDTGDQPISQIMVVSPDKIAWKQSGAIWTLQVSGNNFPEQLWKPQTNGLSQFDFSPQLNRYLVTLADSAGGHELVSFDPNTKTASFLEHNQNANIRKAAWLNSGNAYAYLSDEHGGDALHLSSHPSSEDDLFREGGVIDFKVRGGMLFVYGNQGNEPPEVWESNLAGEQLRCLTPVSGKAFDFSTVAHHSFGTLTNGSRVITYHSWSPPHPKKGVRYGLILTQTPAEYNPYALMAANAGYYFVSINRQTWQRGIENWESDVMAVYSEFTNRPDVDRHNVYLYGHSAETRAISNLTSSHPRLWKGIVVASPSDLPILPGCSLSRIFIDGRGLERGAVVRLSRYQSQAAQLGIPVTLVIHPTAHHTSWSIATERVKIQETALFLSSD